MPRLYRPRRPHRPQPPTLPSLPFHHSSFSFSASWLACVLIRFQARPISRICCCDQDRSTVNRLKASIAFACPTTFVTPASQGGSVRTIELPFSSSAKGSVSRGFLKPGSPDRQAVWSKLFAWKSTGCLAIGFAPPTPMPDARTCPLSKSEARPLCRSKVRVGPVRIVRDCRPAMVALRIPLLASRNARRPRATARQSTTGEGEQR